MFVVWVADLVNLQKIVPTSKDTLFSLRVGDDFRHSLSESTIQTTSMSLMCLWEGMLASREL